MRSAQWISTAANVLLAVCAVTVTALVLRHDVFPPSHARQAAEVRQVGGWQRYAATGHRTGPAGAPVEVVVYSDFQCPACRTLATYLNALRAEQPGRIAVVHKHLPLGIHAFAVPAAVASECAARQGKFDAYHDALFEQQSSIGFAPWSRFAVAAGVPDVPAFDRCVAAPGRLEALARDTAEARELHFSATPSFMVNGRLFSGTPPLDTLRAVIARMEAGQGGNGAPLASGDPRLRPAGAASTPASFGRVQ